MYSYEIQKELEKYNYHLSPIVYSNIFSFTESPQIVSVKYDSFDDKFHVATNDGYSWTFVVDKYY